MNSENGEIWRLYHIANAIVVHQNVHRLPIHGSQHMHLLPWLRKVLGSVQADAESIYRQQYTRSGSISEPERKV